MERVLTNSLLSLISERELADSLDLEAIQGEHNLSGESIYKLLNDQGVLDLASQLELMAEYLVTDVIDINAIDFTEELLNLIPWETARKYNCMPIGLDGETLHLCMVDPLNPTLLDELAFLLKRPLKIRIGSPETIQSLIDDKYSTDDSFDDLTDIQSGVNVNEDEEDKGESGGNPASPATSLFLKLVGATISIGCHRSLHTNTEFLSL